MTYVLYALAALGAYRVIRRIVIICRAEYGSYDASKWGAL